MKQQMASLKDLRVILLALGKQGNWRAWSAESTTAGKGSDHLTMEVGGGAFFERGFAVYTLNSKLEELGMPKSFFRIGPYNRMVAEGMWGGLMLKAKYKKYRHIGFSVTGSLASSDSRYPKGSKPGTVFITVGTRIGFTYRYITRKIRIIETGKRGNGKKQVLIPVFILMIRMMLDETIGETFRARNAKELFAFIQARHNKPARS